MMLDRILKAVSSIEGIDSGGIYISDRLTGDLILKAHYGFSSEFVREVAHYTPDTPNWRLIQAGQPSYLKYSEDIKKRHYLLIEGLRAVAVIPVVQQGRVLGSLNLGSHIFDEIPVHTRMLLETIAGQLKEVVARIKSEEELKDTKNYLDKVIKSSYDSIFVVDKEGRFEFGNDAFFDMVGFPESEILGQSFMNVIHPDFHDFILKRWDEVQRGEGRPYEVDIVQKNGTVRSLSVSHIDMELGGKRKYCVIAKDITQRKRMDEALRESNSLLFNAFNNSPLMMTISDISTETYIEVNDSFCKVSGFNRDEAIGKTSIELGWISKEERTQMIQGLKQDGKVAGIELSLTDKGGKKIICRYSGDIIQTPKGNKLFSAAEDITEYKKAEEDLRKSQQEYHTILQTAMDGFWVVNIQGHFHDVNKAYCKIIGYSREELLGMTIRDVEFLETESQTHQHMQNIIDNGYDFFETKHRRKDWQIIDVEASVNYLPNEGKLFVFLRDITDRKQAEESILTSLDEKIILLHEVHHRVKNNLQIVSSLLNLQATRIKNREAIEALRETSNRIHSMALLHETLNISGNLSRVNFSTYIKNICVHIIRSYGSKAEKIKLENQLAEILIDLDQAVPCGLIINELVSNSLKHAFPEGRKGRITVKLQMLPDDHIILSVADDGIGLPGFDIGQTETLGLKLVTILTEKLKGSVEIIREQGTTFHIRFKSKMNKEGQL